MEVERSASYKDFRKFVASVLKEVNSDVFPYVQTSLTKDPSPNNDSSEKAEENFPNHAAHKGRSKNKVELVVNVEELTSDEEPLTNIVTPSIAKILHRHKGKTISFEDSPSREVKRKAGGLKGTPSRSFIGKSLDVHDITPIKISANKKSHDTRSKAPLDNASLHFVKNSERWKYVIQRRVALERELGKDALKCNEVMELIEFAGLMKTVTHFGPCYENLVKEFVVTIPDGYDDKMSVDYGKVYVRGNVITFSPTVINKFLGRIDEPQVELGVTDDQVCKEITAKQVRHWTNKGKLSAGTHVPDIVMTSSQTPGLATSKKSVFAQLKDTCKELEDSIRSNTTTKIKLETLMKAMMEEENKESVYNGDANEGNDDEDYAGEDDADKEK
ncbi:uncharacterized protein LOC127121742 [Lathyrus oleraceus]|uniref:uncharacterized protein LOC127121742 n=1 Tax=Pisum sativum TaxID=3888 RepID=UPI0021D3D67F|nr:uncharacterized protein LOC127121742 [Pisum sativum]